MSTSIYAIISLVIYVKDFHETIFLKEDSSMDTKRQIMIDNNRTKSELFEQLDKGVAGEKQTVYHLKKSNIGMFVLRDVNFIYNDLKAQIDFVVVTSNHCYFIECKNYYADIVHVDASRNFELSKRYGSKYSRKGIKSPLSQVDAQLAVFNKICFSKNEEVMNILGDIILKDYFKTMVVFTNPDQRLDVKDAPDDIKHRILKVDNLIRQIELDEEHSSNINLTKEQMEEFANFVLQNNVNIKVENYYELDSTNE